ncbi:MAG: OmpH family outer membrane protein [Opitutaceae bacterium]|jgi:outer membrane protein
MKNTVRSLLAIVIACSTALVAQAQPAPKIMVIDMAKLYDSHYKTEEQNNKLRGDEQKAQEELDRLNKEGNVLVEQFKELQEQVNNPASTADAKQKAQTTAQAKYEEIRKKQAEVQSFQTNTRNSLQQRISNFKTLMLEEISKAAMDIAKKKGCNILLEKSGPSLIGVPAVIYIDASYEITDEVMVEVNKGRPAAPAVAPAAAAPTPAAAAPATAAPAPADPVIKVPGAKK